MKKKFYIFVLVLFIPLAAYAQTFVDKGYHPKITAVGRSVVALTEDAALMFYNPASVGFTQSVNVFASYTNLYPDIIDENMNVVNAGAAYPLGTLGVVGVGVSQFSPKFWSEQIFIGSFATRMLMDNLSLGGSIKILRWSAEAPQGENAVPESPLSYTGFTVDIGTTYFIAEVMEENDLYLGASLLNITQPTTAHDGSSDAVLPMEVNVGTAYVSRKFNYKILGGIGIRKEGVRVSFGFDMTALKVHLMGVENEFYVRFGGGRLTAQDSQGEYNGGFGMKIDNIVIDYSYSYQAFIRHVGGISSISVGYEF
ncbi:MAG: type IX secretion system membrane protein PorP/SprF [Bacteroidota bacterium]